MARALLNVNPRPMKIKNDSMVFLLGSLSLTALVALTACEAQVVGGGGGGNGGSGGSGGNAVSSTAATTSGGGNVGGGGTAGGSFGSNAMAMLYSEAQDPNPNPTGTTVSAGGGGPDPNSLLITISNTPENCNDPYEVEPCGDHYRIFITIPVALQKVGIIPLNDPTIISSFSWSGPAEASGSCAGGGGSFFDGELEITAIDGAHVEGILSNTSSFDFNADGPFNAPRCVF